MLKKTLSVIALALSGCLLFASCSPQAQPSASSSANSTATAGATGSNEAGPTVPDQPVNWAPVIDADGTYHFGVGREAFTGTLLTDFTDGTVNTKTSYGKYAYEDGVLKVYSNGSYADSYDNITGGLDDGDYANAVYVGVRVHNNNSEPAWFGLQGDNIFLGETGDDIIIAYDNGRAYATTVEWKTTRFCAQLPANFEGTILIPLSRLYSGTDMNKSTAWTDNRTPWTKLGFHVNCEESNSVDFRYVFLTNETLPEVAPIPDDVDFNITNPEYSYTDEQRITPFWSSNIMYNECLSMEENNGGNIIGKLLFVPTRIISVVDAKLQNEYVEGKDYRWIEGTNQIEWLEGSSIPYFYNGALSGLKENGTPVNDYPNWDSEARCRLAGVLYCADKFLWEKQIAVTYEYDQSQVEANGIVYTQQQSDRLPNTTKKLANNESLKVLFYGDSIFAGGDASSGRGREPMMPTMDVLMAEYLRTISSGTITFDNISVGGWTVENGLAALQPGGYAGKDYSQYSGYDLLMLSFGMNNAGTSAESFKATTQEIVETIKEKNPNIEVILVSCICPNPAAAGFYGNQQYFGAALQELADENGYAFVDMFAVHKKILEFKNYSATTGNGINHPNDWLIRIYAQNILSAMVEFE
ncbi:MAG: hypothetical protein DBY09_00260 [Selenomonadales bacterium]|jgi:hypothetical protein|nr:hypothetical protein [Clostridiales bacterium]PWM01354.1 MAG: hypothetical protein DBY09_00260 [Selenomonadales bacterium]